MSKVLKIVAGVALIAAAVVTGGGSLGFLGLTVAKGTLIAIGASVALAGVAEAAFGPKMPQSQLGRLNVSLETTAPRKAVFGTTAMNLDLRYHEASGANQEYIDYVIALAAHKVKSIDEIWFEEKLAWTAAGGVTSTYAGYLTVETITEGSASSYFTINGGSGWGANQRLTGCAQVKLRVKRTGNVKNAESPLVSGLPNRVTIIGDGALLYDPRKDSTVPGGSGTHRVNDQSTWGNYTNADDTDNPALQLLWYLLGWRINGELSVGCGVPANRIDLQGFITAANICDENVTLAIGGTQKRYRTSGTASDSDDRMGVINTFLSCMNGTLRDSGGKLSLTVIKNDLADYVLTFDEGDILDEFEWNQTRGLNDTYTKVRGRYIDPSNNSLYQLVDYPEIEVSGGALDGIDRVMTLDLGYVEDGRRAQRIAKQVLQRNQYKGMFSATFTAKAQGCVVGDVVRLTFPALGWTNKLFRVVSQEIRFDGQVPLVLVEENAAIYAWDADDSAPVSPNAPTVYDPLNNPIIKGIEEATTVSGYLTNEAITLAADSGGTVLSFATAVGTFKMFEGIVDVTTSSSFALTSSSGVTVNINSATGAYSVTAMSASTGSATFTGTYNGATITKVLSVAKSQEGADGANGSPGVSGITGYLTNESVQLFAYANGNIVSYAPATGQFKIFSGNTDISSNFSLSTASNPQGLTVSYASQTYTVSGGFDINEDTASLTIRATGSGAYAGVTLDKVFSLSKAIGGYEIVSSLPSTNLFEGRVVFLTTDDKLYRYTGSAWTAAVPAVDISGQLADAQISALAAAKLTGQITETQITDNAITTNKIAAATITGAKIAAGTIQAGNIAASTITGDKIAANTITASQIAANTITGDKISAGTITATQLATTQLISVSAQIGNLVVDTINIKNNSITQAAVFSNDAGITASASWQTVASVTSGTLAGSNVKIDFSARLIGVADSVSIPAQFRILRGGTVIRSGVLTVFQSKQVLTDFVSGMNYEFYQPVDAVFPMFHLDSGIPAGPHTYSFQIFGTNAFTISERQMIATELRR